MLVERIFVQINFCTYEQIFVYFLDLLAPPITPQQTVETNIVANCYSHFELENQYALVIARFRI